MKLIFLSLLVGSLGASPAIRRGAPNLPPEGPKNLVPYEIKGDGYPEIDPSYIPTSQTKAPVLICDQQGKPIVTEQSSTHGAGSVAAPTKTEVQKSADGQGSASSRK
ncbi:hypothetical protein PGT21_014158 [Puccinia graminis f. sp. tritici]|uniref:Uncharacterized protein n=2 Tax=Puccinia graminis f. sp. tritici TaxID=56615 RepID=E3KUA6_PUCGT|nr:uncharacterized protein PGTG_14596 [Puccinia graminis f. sp. tritici CRL 75-36-700-3]KAA1065882.1 hypothetical protein PGT21_014167 [Puccinia graminis f. sp. tritici]EFP87881.1 hypothetical protein PGTG_14596 [Puccinia graminis f. sp. tritici CRL 75-36-700-3]KAA1103316.1 hypothetical protein PGT21_014158 [Puccinia graminis f. sp. tritici]KAA1104971.1 hypothetical protein PGTUg99_013379 [Puccinia graminis f. sp. tritici]KAA1112405.1 hypothetical protein PGTUg99_020043 [Puccinia graminis f. s